VFTFTFRSKAGRVGALGTVAVLLASGITALTATAARADAPATCADTSSLNGAISGCMAATRAQTWLAANSGQGVIYNQGATYGGYRTDCSGFVSMALHLSTPGLVTGDMYEANGFADVAKDNLQQGDILDNPSAGDAGHVVLFDHWADSAHSSYWGFEEHGPSGSYGTSYRIITYPYDPGSGTYYPQHYTKLTASSTSPTGTHQASQAVAQNSGTVDTLYEGSSGALQHSWGSAGGTAWVGPVSLGGSMASEPSSVTTVAGTVDTFWKGADGNLWHAFTTGQSWSAPANLGYGALGSAPYAVGQADGTVDVFWRGANDDHLWHAHYTAGVSWSSGATDLGGHIAAGTVPAPVVSGSGTTDVFFKGTDGNLWHVFTGDNGSSWTSAASLGFGTLGSSPTATGRPDGTVDVFWRGANDDHLWHAHYTAGVSWSSGATDLGGHIAAGTVPAPVTSSNQTTDVFFKGTDGNLWHVFTYNSGWTSAASLGMGAISQPFVAGQASGAIDVFWKGTADSHIWHAWYTPTGGWSTTPTSLGGSAA
jgi:hypothetical protein